MANASIFLVDSDVVTLIAEAASYEDFSIVFAKRPCADTRATEEEGLSRRIRESPLLFCVL